MKFMNYPSIIDVLNIRIFSNLKNHLGTKCNNSNLKEFFIIEGDSFCFRKKLYFWFIEEISKMDKLCFLIINELNIFRSKLKG